MCVCVCVCVFFYKGQKLQDDNMTTIVSEVEKKKFPPITRAQIHLYMYICDILC